MTAADRPLIPLAHVFDELVLKEASAQSMEDCFLRWFTQQESVITKIDAATSAIPPRLPNCVYAYNHNWDFHDQLNGQALEDLVSVLLHYVTVAAARESLGLPQNRERSPFKEQKAQILSRIERAIDAINNLPTAPKHTPNEQKLRADLMALAAELQADASLSCLRRVCHGSIIFSDDGKRMLNADSVWYRSRALCRSRFFGHPLNIQDMIWTWYLAGICELIEQEKFTDVRNLANNKTWPQIDEIDDYEFFEQLSSMSDERLAALAEAIAPALAVSAFTDENVPGELYTGHAAEAFLPQQIEDASDYFFKGGSFFNGLHMLVDRLADTERFLMVEDVVAQYKSQYAIAYAPTGEQLADQLDVRTASPALWSTPPATAIDEMIGKVSWILQHPQLVGIDADNLQGTLMLPVSYDLYRDMIAWCEQAHVKLDKDDLSILNMHADALVALRFQIHPEVDLVLYNIDRHTAMGKNRTGPDEGWRDFLNTAQMQTWNPKPAPFLGPMPQRISDALARAIDERMQMSCTHEDLREFVLGEDLFETPRVKRDKHEAGGTIEAATLYTCRCCGNPRAGVRLDASVRADSLVQTQRAYAAGSLVFRNELSLSALDEGLEAIRARAPELFEVREKPYLAPAIPAPDLDESDWEDRLML